MCTLRSYFEDRLLAHPDAESLAVDRETAERLLGDCSDCSSGGGPDTDEEGKPWRAMCVSELAELIGVGASTVRGWCHAELYGSKNALMVAGNWVIPADQVQLTVTRYRKGWRVIKNQWVKPEAPPATKRGSHRTTGDERLGTHAEVTTKDTAPSTGGPALDTPPDYGGYEEDA